MALVTWSIVDMATLQALLQLRCHSVALLRYMWTWMDLLLMWMGIASLVIAISGSTQFLEILMLLLIMLMTSLLMARLFMEFPRSTQLM